MEIRGFVSDNIMMLITETSMFGFLMYDGETKPSHAVQTAIATLTYAATASAITTLAGK